MSVYQSSNACIKEFHTNSEKRIKPTYVLNISEGSQVMAHQLGVSQCCAPRSPCDGAVAAAGPAEPGMRMGTSLCDSAQLSWPR